MIDRHSIGDVLKLHIKEKYGTQKDAAKALGLARSDVCQSLSGKKLPSALLLADAGLVQKVVYEQRRVG